MCSSHAHTTHVLLSHGHNICAPISQRDKHDTHDTHTRSSNTHTVHTRAQISVSNALNDMGTMLFNQKKLKDVRVPFAHAMPLYTLKILSQPPT